MTLTKQEIEEAISLRDIINEGTVSKGSLLREEELREKASEKQFNQIWGNENDTSGCR